MSKAQEVEKYGKQQNPKEKNSNGQQSESQQQQQQSDDGDSMLLMMDHDALLKALLAALRQVWNHDEWIDVGKLPFESTSIIFSAALFPLPLSMVFPSPFGSFRSLPSFPSLCSSCLFLCRFANGTFLRLSLCASLVVCLVFVCC